MNEKPNEWVAVADLMSGMLAVVALMLVVAILSIKQQAAMTPKPPPEPPVQTPLVEPAQTQPLAEVVEFLREFDRNNTDPAIRVSVGELRVWLADGAFDKASACLHSSAIQSLKGWRAAFPQHLLENQDSFKVTLEISGHTDSFPVKGGQVNSASKCASYHDNVSLSVARATTAREELTRGLSPEIASYFIVAGYGDTRPLPGIDIAHSSNRRVEVRFIIPSSLGASSQPASSATDENAGLSR